MVRKTSFLKHAVAALFLASPLAAQTDELEALLKGLKTADASAAIQIEQRIYEIWSQSGSPSMDLLLERGRAALEAGDSTLAIRHFSALVDHAPQFAEAYNGRATAYFQAGRLGLSLEDIRRTLELNPQHFSAMTGLALILEELGYPEAALEAWREVARFHPNREGLKEAVARLEREVEGAAL
ncbi:MAG: tetratricopeptide repeat protein [Pseudomonadota bacterium]